MDGSLNLCQASTGQEKDWLDLYESSFPAGERTPKEELLRLLGAGSILLHRTTNKQGELLCFSIVYPMSNFALLSYIATDQTKRSSGVGSKHMKKLIEIVKTQYPTYLGLVLEIESTKEPGLEEKEKTARQRRLAFYQRLGAKRLCKTYVWPSYSHKGSYNLAELMWIDFDPSKIDDEHLPDIIRELYTKGYGATSDDPILELVLHQFACMGKKNGKKASLICPVEKTEATPKAGDASTKDAPAPVEAAKTDATTVADAPKSDAATTVDAPNQDATKPTPSVAGATDAVPNVVPSDQTATADKAAAVEEKKGSTDG